MGVWLCSGRTFLSAGMCFRTCALLAQISAGAPSAARARGSGADNKPTWQLFTPAWHVPLWSNGFLAITIGLKQACYSAGLQLGFPIR